MQDKNWVQIIVKNIWLSLKSFWVVSKKKQNKQKTPTKSCVGDST